MSNTIAHPAKSTSAHSPAARFSLGGMRGWLGLHDQNNRPSPKVPPAQLLVTLEAQIQALELSLRTEQTLGQTALQELTKVRAQMSKIDVLEAELAIERESGARLVHWLERQRGTCRPATVFIGVGQ
jgi:hypothetical protein